MKVLFIGGTGIISSACTELAIQRGIDLYLLNRGETTKRGPLPNGAKLLKGDIRDKASALAALGASMIRPVSFASRLSTRSKTLAGASETVSVIEP